jgi:phospholipid/cholesterol/gamma-HCH transport system permease protein
MVVALHVGSFNRQLGAESATGAVMVLAVIRESAPLACALLISGAGGSAMTADLGSRKIRDEIAAMEVMAINPVHRLVTPRLWAAATIATLLVGLVCLAGLAGGFFFNVIVQGTTAGAYLSGFSAFVQTPDLLQALIKAFVFGHVAAMVACYKGMNARGGPKGVGDAVNQAVVVTFILVFFVNVIMTALYFALVPPKF